MIETYNFQCQFKESACQPLLRCLLGRTNKSLEDLSDIAFPLPTTFKKNKQLDSVIFSLLTSDEWWEGGGLKALVEMPAKNVNWFCVLPKRGKIRLYDVRQFKMVNICTYVIKEFR